MKAHVIVASLCRWTARIAGILLVVVLLVFAIGEGMPNLLTLPIWDQIAFLGLALIMVGILLGWRFELAGGIMALVGFFLVFVSLFIGKGLALPGFFIALAMPGVLYITSVVLRRSNQLDDPNKGVKNQEAEP